MEPINIVGPALLFCPGDRPERFRKAVDAADMAVLDLEDGVSADAKDRARSSVVDFVRQHSGPLAVRINHPITERGQADAKAVIAAGCRVLLLPKTQSSREVDLIAVSAGSDCPRIIVTVETARGFLDIAEILRSPHVSAVAWGPYDLAADLGMRQVRDPATGRYLGPIRHARDRLVFEAARDHTLLLDTVTTEFGNAELLAADVKDAATYGFQGKFSIHPNQVAAIRAGFRPPAAEVERSRRLLAAADGFGAFAFEGEMIDEPILRRARFILAAAGDK